jgi:hypothetical protein
MTAFGGVGGTAAFGSVSAFALEMLASAIGVSAFAFESPLLSITFPAGPLLLEAPPESGTSTFMFSSLIRLIMSNMVLAFALAGSADSLRVSLSDVAGSLGSRDALRLCAVGLPGTVGGCTPPAAAIFMAYSFAPGGGGFAVSGFGGGPTNFGAAFTGVGAAGGAVG